MVNSIGRLGSDGNDAVVYIKEHRWKKYSLEILKTIPKLSFLYSKADEKGKKRFLGKRFKALPESQVSVMKERKKCESNMHNS